MLRRIRIQNYKSILDDTIELGRINVFIGENGCGKTNVLEAVAMAGAASDARLESEELFNRGIRLAKPSLTLSSFSGREQQKSVVFEVTGPDDSIPLIIEPRAKGSREVPWEIHAAGLKAALGTVTKDLEDRRNQLEVWIERLSGVDDDSRSELMGQYLKWSDSTRPVFAARDLFWDGLSEFAVYNLNALALRGLNTESRKEPLGIYGEGLDVAIAGLGDEQRRALKERASCIAWMEDILIDAEDRLKLQGFKPARSTSTLYFVDRFLSEGNYFSAENANEGILHILFYLVLFVHPAAPRMFGIDNIETALNPQLCRDLMKQLAELAKAHDKQALITTHNPAVLDGLNLHDEEQRLFVVERSDEGHTKTRRITLKPDAGDGHKYKLSELWMRGFLGGLPRGF
jgi:energy-coupling factor transporter ATP-binding protein EcfA2